jgi:hypothetical protein
MKSESTRFTSSLAWLALAAAALLAAGCETDSGKKKACSASTECAGGSCWQGSCMTACDTGGGCAGGLVCQEVTNTEGQPAMVCLAGGGTSPGTPTPCTPATVAWDTAAGSVAQVSVSWDAAACTCSAAAGYQSGAGLILDYLTDTQGYSGSTEGWAVVAATPPAVSGSDGGGGSFWMIQGLTADTPTTLQLSGPAGEAVTVGFTLGGAGAAALSIACP